MFADLGRLSLTFIRIIYINFTLPVLKYIQLAALLLSPMANLLKLEQPGSDNCGNILIIAPRVTN